MAPAMRKTFTIFSRLGIDQWFTIAAKHNRGVSELMDEVIKALPQKKPSAEEESAIKIAVLGRPNVGKSSLVNRILGYNRVIVSELRGRPGMRLIPLLSLKASGTSSLTLPGSGKKAGLATNSKSIAW